MAAFGFVSRTARFSSATSSSATCKPRNGVPSRDPPSKFQTRSKYLPSCGDSDEAMQPPMNNWHECSSRRSPWGFSSARREAPVRKKATAILAANIFIRHQPLSEMPLFVLYTKWEIPQAMMDDGSVLIWPCATDAPTGRDGHIWEWISHGSHKNHIKTCRTARAALIYR